MNGCYVFIQRGGERDGNTGGKGHSKERQLWSIIHNIADKNRHTTVTKIISPPSTCSHTLPKSIAANKLIMRPSEGRGYWVSVPHEWQKQTRADPSAPNDFRWLHHAPLPSISSHTQAVPPSIPSVLWAENAESFPSLLSAFVQMSGKRQHGPFVQFVIKWQKPAAEECGNDEENCCILQFITSIFQDTQLQNNTFSWSLHPSLTCEPVESVEMEMKVGALLKTVSAVVS